MKIHRWLVLGFMTFISVATGISGAMGKANDDPDRSLMWLEEIEGAKSLDWVRAHNQKTLGALTADPRFERYKSEAFDILTASDRIVSGSLRGAYIYNFWQDKDHVRGIWRRTDVASYKSGTPKWDVILDVDRLAEEEGENWVFAGADCLAPDYTRCMLGLSPGGTDAAHYREYDIEKRAFVVGGFDVPLAKSNIGWEDDNTLLIATNWGKGSQTTSGYSRILKRWTRGTPLSSAKVLVEMEETETFIYPLMVYRQEGGAVFVQRNHTFYEATYYVVVKDRAVALPLPRKLDLEGMLGGQLLVKIKEDWRGFNAGALLSFDLADFIKSGKITTPILVFDPGHTGTIDRVVVSKDAFYMVFMEHVSSRIREFGLKDGQWTSRKIDFGGEDVISIVSATSASNDMLVARDGLLTPNSLYFVNFKEGAAEKIQSIPPRFDTTGLKVEKKMAQSPDGTNVPYFLVYKQGTKMDGSTPVLQYGYGGFEISILPHYSALLGKLWLEKGGAYVIANIRGGGEYGPRWHEAALRENRERAYEDFFAVAEAVQASGLSSPAHYGAVGRSNGGLLMGVAFTQRPDLFSAIICGVPLLDMKRYNKLLAGASWMAEYGNPDTDDWDFIKKYSPLQNLEKDKKYPRVYFFTSTKDDRVHPAHARKMAAKMEEMGHDFYYYENTEGGHKGTANYDQEATMRALEYLYLMRELGGNKE